VPSLVSFILAPPVAATKRDHAGVTSAAKGRSRFLCLLLVSFASVSAAACAPHSAHDRQSVSRELSAFSGTGLRDDVAVQLRLPPGLRIADGLTEDEAVAIALWNNAAFQAELATLGIARADLIEAGMIQNPLLSLFLPWGPRQAELTLSLPLQALWQRGRRVKAARLDLERVASGLVAAGLDLIRDTKMAYAALALAQERERLGREAVRVRGRVAGIAEARLRAGDVSVLESGVIRLDARQAEEELLRALLAVASARSALIRQLGLEGTQPDLTVGALAVEARTIGDLAAAVELAMAARPDLRAAELAIESAGARLGWERTRIVSNLDAAAKATGGKGEWVVGPGVSLEIPLFNLNQGPRARAHAEIERAIWQYAATRHRLLQEVHDAHQRYLHTARTEALLRQEILPGLEQNLARAEKAYAAGEVSYLFVLETMRQRLDAGLRAADATAELARAAAQLDRSIGRKRVAKSP
jgi:outer membrane protein, heavy metal efflux system